METVRRRLMPGPTGRRRLVAALTALILDDPVPDGPVPEVPMRAVPVVTARRRAVRVPPAHPAARAVVWLGHLPRAAASRAPVAHDRAASPAGHMDRDQAPRAVAPAREQVRAHRQGRALSRRARVAHLTTAQRRRSLTQTPAHEPREKPALDGSPSPASADHLGQVPTLARSPSQAVPANQATRASPQAPSAVAPPAERSAGSC